MLCKQSNVMTFSGRILDHLGDMKTHDKAYGEAEMMLTKALRCMEKSNSNIGKATVLYHIGYLRYITVFRRCSVLLELVLMYCHFFRVWYKILIIALACVISFSYLLLLTVGGI